MISEYDEFVIVRMSKTITLPFWNDVSRWVTLYEGYTYQIPKVYADNLMFQGYINPEVKNDNN